MTKAIATTVLGFLCVCAQLNAQDSDFETITRDGLSLGEVDVAPALALSRPDLFSVRGGSLLLHTFPVAVFLDGRRFPISGEANRMGITPLDLIPVSFLSSVRVYPMGVSPALASDAPGGVVDLRRQTFTGGGEVGFFYGGSGGKFGREDFSTYIKGGVGTERLQISAGAAYQNSSGRVRSY